MSVEFRDPIDLNQLELQNAAIQNLGSDPAAPVEGQIWQRTDLKKTKVRAGSKSETVRYESNNVFDASTASGNGPLVVNTDGSGTDTALSIGALANPNSPRLLVDIATTTPKLSLYTPAAVTSMEPTLIQAIDADSNTEITANSVKVARTDITQSMEMTTSDILQDGVSIFDSYTMRYAGVTYPGPEWTSGGTGIIVMPTCECNLYRNPNQSGRITKYTVPSATFILTDGGDQLVVANWNAGSPIYQLVDAVSAAYNNSDIIPVYRFWRVGSTIHSQSVDSLGDGLPEKIAERIGNTEYYKRTEAGGLIIGAAGLTLTITAANVYAGAVRVAIGAFSSATNTLYRVTLNATTWTYTPSTTINNTYYNTNAGLVTAGANKYLVAFYYSSIGDAVEAFEILGTDQYSNIGAAIAAAPRADLPSVVAKHCMLVGRVVIQKGAATASEIDSTFTTQFASSGVTDHNSLSNLQSAQSGVTYGHITDWAQTIDGVKTFSSQIVATSVKSAGPSLYLLDSAGAVRIQCDTSPAEVVIQGNLLPMVDDAYNIGSTSLKPHYIYSSKLYTADISIGENPISVYVDGRIANSTGVVHTSGNENVAGVKTFRNNVSMTASYASLNFVPPTDSGNDSKQAVRFSTAAGAWKSFVGYGAGVTNEYLRVVTIGTLAIATPKVLIGTITSGTASGDGGSMAIGSWGGDYCGMWAGALTPSASNEGIRLGSTATLINSPGVDDNVHIRHGETKKNVVFNADPIANATTQSTVTAAVMGAYSTSGWGIWSGNVTPSSANYAFYCSAGTGEINGATHSLMSVAGVGVVDATASAVTITLGGSAQQTIGTNFTLFGANPVMPINTTGLSSGSISWDMDSYKNLTATSALTGNITVNMSNNRSGRSTLFSFTNGSASRQVNFSCSGVTFRYPGSPSVSNGSFGISASALSVNANYTIRFEWLTATICAVITEKA